VTSPRSVRSFQLIAFCLEKLPGTWKARGKSLASGAALARFREIIRAHGGTPEVIDDYSLLPAARQSEPLVSPEAGYIEAMDTERIGIAMCVLGAGRERVDSVIDPAVGMRLHKKLGSRVEKGEPLGTLYFNDEARYREACRLLLESYRFSEMQPELPVLIKAVIAT
jgi:pyrimidine-nucleoside phosphorylase